jgi:hypothetical protein
VGVVAVEIDLATGHFEVAVDEVHQAVGQIAGEVRAEVGGAILAQTPGDVDAGEFLIGELDVGVGFVVAEKDIEAGLVLLDEVIFQAQGFFFVVDGDVGDIAGAVDEGAGFGFEQAVVIEVVANAGTEIFGFADVNYGSGCV